jgi:hypothetical protein
VITVGRNRIVHIDNGRHLGQLADAVAAEFFRIAAAIAPLVVVQRDVERDGTDFRRLQQMS